MKYTVIARNMEAGLQWAREKQVDLHRCNFITPTSTLNGSHQGRTFSNPEHELVFIKGWNHLASGDAQMSFLDAVHYLRLRYVQDRRLQGCKFEEYVLGAKSTEGTK